jgi:hypothetical protein
VPSLSLPVVFRVRRLLPSRHANKYFGNNGVGNMRIHTFDYVEQLGICPRFFARTKIPVLLLDLDQEANSWNHLSF